MCGLGEEDLTLEGGSEINANSLSAIKACSRLGIADSLQRVPGAHSITVHAGPHRLTVAEHPAVLQKSSLISHWLTLPQESFRQSRCHGHATCLVLEAHAWLQALLTMS